MRFSVRLVVVPLLVFLAAACHDVPQAPTTKPPVVSPFSVVVLDPLATDYPTWTGVDLLLDDVGEVHVVSVNFDALLHRFFYAGCAQICQQPGRWFPGVPDSSLNCCDANQGAALAAGTVTAVVQISQGIQLKTCPGDCFKPSSWATSNLFRPGFLGDFEGHSHPLAVDSAGALHLVYHATRTGPLRYAECASACGDSSAWQSLAIDPDSASGPLIVDAAIAVDRAGNVNVVGATPNGPVLYLRCATGCLTASNWSAAVIDSTKARSPSLALASDTALSVAYVSQIGASCGSTAVCSTRFATCVSQCTAASHWTSLRVAPTGIDVSLALDGANRPWLAIANRGGTVDLLHCSGDCTAASGWVSQPVDSMRGWGWVSLAIDGAGAPHIAATGFQVQYAQLRVTTVFSSPRCSTSCSH